VAEAILKRDGDVVCISATGSGKTLTFWLPLLFRPNGIQLVISPSRDKMPTIVLVCKVSDGMGIFPFHKGVGPV
ncbi:hypothetical protein B0H17DRAFT_924702, partial [Mycena rosella]